MKLTQKGKMLMAILAIAFLAYYVILFVLCGFSGHTATFWLSYAMMTVAFLAMAIVGSELGTRGMLMRDWLFGIPVVKHTAVYLILELIASVIFILFEKKVSWGWAFSAQFVLLCFYAIFAISCFLAKAAVEEIHVNAEDKTCFIKLLRVDADLIAEECENSELKTKCQAFSEAVRNSDPMSSESLFELEKELTLSVSDCKTAVEQNDYAAAELLLNKAERLLSERNKKCKALK